MTFAEAAMIMMSGGKKPNIKPLSVTQNGPYNAADYGVDGFDPVLVNVPSAPLSLESIKSLKNLAIVTIGDYIFEIKEPAMLYSGIMETYYNVIHESGFKSGQYSVKLISSAVVNNQIAAIHPYGIATNGISWGSYEAVPDPLFPEEKVHCSTRYKFYTDFKVDSITPGIFQYHLPSMQIHYTCTENSWYDDHIESRSWDAAFRADLEFHSSSPSLIHNLNVDEYFNFVNDYCENSASIAPVIKIL